MTWLDLLAYWLILDVACAAVLVPWIYFAPVNESYPD